MHIESVKEHRAVAGRFVDQFVVILNTAESGVLEGETLHPSTGSDSCALGAQ